MLNVVVNKVNAGLYKWIYRRLKQLDVYLKKAKWLTEEWYKIKIRF